MSNARVAFWVTGIIFAVVCATLGIGWAILVVVCAFLGYYVGAAVDGGLTLSTLAEPLRGGRERFPPR